MAELVLLNSDDDLKSDEVSIGTCLLSSLAIESSEFPTLFLPPSVLSRNRSPACQGLNKEKCLVHLSVFCPTSTCCSRLCCFCLRSRELTGKAFLIKHELDRKTFKPHTLLMVSKQIPRPAYLFRRDVSVVSLTLPLSHFSSRRANPVVIGIVLYTRIQLCNQMLTYERAEDPN
eukprot:764992-Hanusia_phi.AAC.2